MLITTVYFLVSGVRFRVSGRIGRSVLSDQVSGWADISEVPNDV
jgi:hypothetical protein